MSHAVDSKQAAAYLIDPMNAPEPSAETGPGSHFGSSFRPKEESSAASRDSLGSNNPFRDDAGSTTAQTSKKGAHVSTRSIGSSGASEGFPNYREESFAGYSDKPRRSGDGYDANHSPQSASQSGTRPRRTSSLRERFPGDHSHKPLDVIRRDSRKANRSPHLSKRHIPGADSIDKLDPAVGGIAYHHEGPFDAALLARNTSHKNSPVAALSGSNEEALKATPKENIKNALERHKPLDGTAVVPPGVPDQFGRTYNYEEGTDMMRDAMNTEPGYKRYADKDYDPEDYKGEAEPAFSLDRALKTHKIDDRGIEMEDHAHLAHDYHEAERAGKLDPRDPVTIAGGDAKYAELQHANNHELESSVRRTGSLRAAGEGLKKRLGSLRKKHDD